MVTIKCPNCGKIFSSVGCVYTEEDNIRVACPGCGSDYILNAEVGDSSVENYPSPHILAKSLCRSLVQEDHFKIEDDYVERIVSFAADLLAIVGYVPKNVAAEAAISSDLVPDTVDPASLSNPAGLSNPASLSTEIEAGNVKIRISNNISDSLLMRIFQEIRQIE